MTRQQRNVARSVSLFRAFLKEQTEPAIFYGALAEDSVATLQDHIDLHGATVVDVGAGPAEFADRFRAAGARYVALDHDRSVASVARGGLVASASQLPLADASVDVIFCSNLWEHVEQPEAVGDELLRVIRPGGLLFLSYTNWLSPWGGHETSPWHWLGGERAVRRYRRRHGHEPKNRVGQTLFRVTVAQGLRWSAASPHGEVVAARPRYYPDWARTLVSVPWVREVLTWNLLLIVRRH
ncbi:class I SAM-dependent methyltransferase [Demetria terragena]|uniref:class I SAM-dependent methyltransferase n=1 Tax=Demetria terragena TaxID=63959 RepID=UPI000379DB75|nr:class I SAM-dependent methyltransferase [Demetria terragena]